MMPSMLQVSTINTAVIRPAIASAKSLVIFATLLSISRPAYTSAPTRSRRPAPDKERGNRISRNRTPTVTADQTSLPPAAVPPPIRYKPPPAPAPTKPEKTLLRVGGQRFTAVDDLSVPIQQVRTASHGTGWYRYLVASKTAVITSASTPRQHDRVSERADDIQAADRGITTAIAQGWHSENAGEMDVGIENQADNRHADNHHPLHFPDQPVTARPSATSPPGNCQSCPTPPTNRPAGLITRPTPVGDQQQEQANADPGTVRHALRQVQVSCDTGCRAVKRDPHQNTARGYGADLLPQHGLKAVKAVREMAQPVAIGRFLPIIHRQRASARYREQVETNYAAGAEPAFRACSTTMTGTPSPEGSKTCNNL